MSFYDYQPHPSSIFDMPHSLAAYHPFPILLFNPTHPLFSAYATPFSLSSLFHFSFQPPLILYLRPTHPPSYRGRVRTAFRLQARACLSYNWCGVWLCHSPIPVVRERVFYLFICRLPAFVAPKGGEGEVGTLCDFCARKLPCGCLVMLVGRDNNSRCICYLWGPWISRATEAEFMNVQFRWGFWA